MWPRQSAHYWLARSARKDDTSTIYGKVPMAGSSPTHAFGRRGKERALQIVARGDGVQLDPVAVEQRTVVRLDTPGPPRRLERPVAAQANNGVQTNGICVEHAANERHVVQVQAPR